MSFYDNNFFKSKFFSNPFFKGTERGKNFDKKPNRKAKAKK